MKSYKGPDDIDEEDTIYLNRPDGGGGTNDGAYIWVG